MERLLNFNVKELFPSDLTLPYNVTLKEIVVDGRGGVTREIGVGSFDYKLGLTILRSVETAFLCTNL